MNQGGLLLDQQARLYAHLKRTNLLAGSELRAEACQMGIAAAPRTVGDIETFITMLRSACSDRAVYERLERLLSLPDTERRGVVHAWISDLLIAGAPTDFVQAVGCLLDDRVAERAYEEIYRCAGEGLAAKLKRWVGGWR
jgi:hypothetical protein